MPLAKFTTFALAALLALRSLRQRGKTPASCASPAISAADPASRSTGTFGKPPSSARNPGWTLELIDLGNEDAGAYYRRAIATGDLPHVVMTLDYTKFLANGDHLLPIPRAIYDRVGQNLPPLHNGQYYTAQVGRQITGIAINKRIWAEAGITEPPQTWDALIAALHKIKAAGYKPLVYGRPRVVGWSASLLRDPNQPLRPNPPSRRTFLDGAPRPWRKSPLPPTR